MTTWLPIAYRGYWDVPRIIVTRSAGRTVLLDCQFDDELDDYPDEYTVFLLPDDTDIDSLPEDWRTLRSLATQEVGVILVERVRFDEFAKPKQMDAAVIDELLVVPTGRPGDVG